MRKRKSEEKSLANKGLMNRAINNEISFYRSTILRLIKLLKACFVKIVEVPINEPLKKNILFFVVSIICTIAIVILRYSNAFIFTNSIFLCLCLWLTISLAIACVHDLHAIKVMEKLKHKNMLHKSQKSVGFTETKITSILLWCVLLVPILVGYIMIVLGFDLIIENLLSCLFALVIGLITSIIISVYFVAYLINLGIVVHGINGANFIMFFCFLLWLLIIYMVLRLSFFLIHHQDATDEKKEEKFKQLWGQMRLVIYLVYIVLTVLVKINPFNAFSSLSILFDAMLTGFSLVFMLDTYISKKAKV